MKNKLKNIIYACLAGIVVLLIPLFLSKERVIEIDLPTLELQELVAQEEAQEKVAQQSAKQAVRRRIVQCSADEDCIIVDKDPCGCLIGPSGVMAINATRTLEFNKIYSKTVTKACPDREPSTEKECAPSARAVCRANTCKIAY